MIIRNLTRRATVVVAGILLVLGLGAIAAAPASAAWSECADNELCLFDGGSGGDPMLVFYTPGWEHTGCQNLAPSIDNKTSSAFNRFHGSATVTFYSAANCTDANKIPFCLPLMHTDLPSQTSVTFADANGCGVGNEVTSLYFH